MVTAMVRMSKPYGYIGAVNPAYHGFASLTKKKEIAASYGAFEPENKRIIGVLHFHGTHWVAFFLDRETQICQMFDPLQSSATYEAIQTSVRYTMEPLLNMTDEITYEEIDWCTQKDADSCGLWCLVILELLLTKKSWNDSLYKLVPYLRLRQLYKFIECLNHVTIDDD
ncbi:hypothetical protein BBJ28_00003333 [Nothophytophthora sp. Chile5]|nr:hypothetical protein BBJ28_00003333 [Nothophytophthora sp. Chile5]